MCGVDQSRSDAWPTVSARTAELIRRGAIEVSEPTAAWIEDLHRASLSSGAAQSIASDPVLAASTRRANLATLMGWIAANIERPGRRVPPALSPDALAHARDLVRRGMEAAAQDGYRKAQSVAWQRWMEACFGLTDDPAELQDLLQVSAHSISTYVDDTMEAVSAQMQLERADLTTGTHAERLETVTLLLEGAPLDPRTAETRLGYRLTGTHTAAVVWGAPGVDPGRLESTAESLLAASGAGQRLTVIANASTLWVWFPREVPEDHRLQALVPDEVHVAVGRPAAHREGFRSSHLDAMDVQRTIAQAGSRRRLAFHRGIQLVALLGRDRQAADAFLDSTLGALQTAEAELRVMALTYIQEQCNVARTAERLYTHRNTVLRRLRRVDELLPLPLAENTIHVGAALELLSWRTP